MKLPKPDSGIWETSEVVVDSEGGEVIVPGIGGGLNIYLSSDGFLEPMYVVLARSGGDVMVKKGADQIEIRARALYPYRKYCAAIREGVCYLYSWPESQYPLSVSLLTRMPTSPLPCASEQPDDIGI